MKSHPMLFSAPMVRALLDGSKTQTRRVVKPQPDTRAGLNCTRLIFKDRKGSPLLDEALEATEPVVYRSLCPYGQPGDQLWVRERVRLLECGEVDYFADGRETWERMQDHIVMPDAAKWKPSIHMPRWASRITMEIVSVRVERLQDISDADALAEGVDRTNTSIPGYARQRYETLWNSINGPASWEANPWVWCIEFKRVSS